MITTPECDKLSAISDESQSIGEFIDFMWRRHEALFGRHVQDHDPDDGDFTDCNSGDGCECEWRFAEMSGRMEAWLAEYFNIDLKKIEEEKLAILEFVRNG